MCHALGIVNTADFYRLPRADIFAWWAYVPFNAKAYRHKTKSVTHNKILADLKAAGLGR